MKLAANNAMKPDSAEKSNMRAPGGARL
jgi:hypothetical protein